MRHFRPVPLAPLAAGLALVAIVSACPAASSRVNVRDHGALGDGKADDTEAIKAAIAACSAARQGGQMPGHPLYWNSGPELYFPSGYYRISDTLTLPAIVRGEGEPVIEQTVEDKDLFQTTYSWRNTIEGLTFIGGRTQVHITNPNIDTGYIQIRDCRFNYSAGPALVMKPQSANLVVEDCIFVECEQAIVAQCDQFTLQRAWITGSPRMRDKAVMELACSISVVDGLLGVPLPNNTDQRWIDNRSMLLNISNTRFGGEGGGYTPIVNFSRYDSTLIPTTISLESSLVCAGANAKRACAIYCEEVPNSIVMRRCSVAAVPAILVSDTLDLRRYFKGVRPEALHYAIEDSVGPRIGDVPALLRTPIIHPRDPIAEITEKQTAAALARAVRIEQGREPESSAPREANGHRQQTDPERYIDLFPPAYTWNVAPHMGSTDEPNSEYLALAPAGDDLLILRRAKGKWPSALIAGVELDLDKTPWLTWRQKRPARGRMMATAVAVRHIASGRSKTLVEEFGTPTDALYAFDLRKEFELEGGRHAFDINFFHLGYAIGKDAADIIYQKPGEWIVVDFMRAEAD